MVLKNIGGSIVTLGRGKSSENMFLNFDELLNNDIHERRSDSSNSLMDFDVICDKVNDKTS